MVPEDSLVPLQSKGAFSFSPKLRSDGGKTSRLILISEERPYELSEFTDSVSAVDDRERSIVEWRSAPVQ